MKSLDALARVIEETIAPNADAVTERARFPVPASTRSPGPASSG